MAIIKRDAQLEQVLFTFNETGDVSDIHLQVNFAIYDDTADKQITRVRQTESVWADLTAGQKGQADAIGKRLQLLAQRI